MLRRQATLENVEIEDASHVSIDDHVALVHDPAVERIVKTIES